MTNNKKKSKILYAKPNHIDAIYAIEKKCFPNEIGYSKQELTYLILHTKNICLIETLNQVIRAFLIINFRSESLLGRIITIDVDPAFQNQGIASRLLKRAEADMKQIGMQWSQLEVAQTNKAAIALYTKAGYVQKEKIKNYYKSKQHGNRDAIRMIKTLSKN
jgi:ribosomal-protein-alanine N-acetyltransferase